MQGSGKGTIGVPLVTWRLVFSSQKTPEEDFDLIRFLALGGEARCAGMPLFEESLDVAFFKRDQGRAAIDDAANRCPMAFAKGRHPEEWPKVLWDMGYDRHEKRLGVGLNLSGRYFGASGEGGAGRAYLAWYQDRQGHSGGRNR